MKIGFGGGCHWCTEAVFQALAGVDQVDQGWYASTPPDHRFSEAVRVTFNPQQIPQDTLIEVHLHTHASTSSHKFRSKYRSAVYVFDQQQRNDAEMALKRLQADFDKPLLTRVLDARTFRLSDEAFQNYYRTDPDRPFCRRYISPKLDKIRKRFGDNQVHTE